MSLFSDIVNSIGSDKSPAPPKPPPRPLSANTPRSTLDVSKANARPSLPANPSPLNGTKRKAEDGSPKQPEKLVKTSSNPTPGLTGRVAQRPAAPPLNAPKPSNEKSLPVPRPKVDVTSSAPKPSSAPTTPTVAAAKPPAKGSYADLMARAKQAQTERTQQAQIGMIKHQATNREKVSKVAERRRQEEERAKSAKDKHGSARPAAGGKQQVKSRSVSPAKKPDQPKVPKVARPPLHAPQTSTYKGTMGIASGQSKVQEKKRARYDEYLATDDEGDSDDMGRYGEDEEDDFGSDASSDMEAGAFEVDEEEERASKIARKEDAEELARENQLKREKEERRRRLMTLASKKK